MTVFGIVLQVVLGLIVVLAVFWLSLYVIKQDRLVVDNKMSVNNKTRTRIVDGFIEATNVANKSFSTVNPNARAFTYLPRSYNRKGGTQFTYSFWLYLGDTSADNVRNKDILLRGDRREYTYERRRDGGAGGHHHGGAGGQHNDSHHKGSAAARSTTDVVVKAPRIRFGQTFDELVVEFNTVDDPDHQVRLNPNKHRNDTTLRHNVLGLIHAKWVLLTFVFEDNVAINDFEDGIVMRFYVNDLLYNTHRHRGALRLNDDDLHLFPSGDVRSARIGDLNYYNYALSTLAVKDLYDAGPPKKYAKNLFDRNELGDPLYLSEYNKLDIYNM